MLELLCTGKQGPGGTWPMWSVCQFGMRTLGSLDPQALLLLRGELLVVDDAVVVQALERAQALLVDGARACGRRGRDGHGLGLGREPVLGGRRRGER